jgi:hypothetical protein
LGKKALENEISRGAAYGAQRTAVASRDSGDIRDLMIESVEARFGL